MGYEVTKELTSQTKGDICSWLAQVLLRVLLPNGLPGSDLVVEGNRLRDMSIPKSDNDDQTFLWVNNLDPKPSTHVDCSVVLEIVVILKRDFFVEKMGLKMVDLMKQINSIINAETDCPSDSRIKAMKDENMAMPMLKGFRIRV
jgi:hypothetical protein